MKFTAVVLVLPVLNKNEMDSKIIGKDIVTAATYGYIYNAAYIKLPFILIYQS